MSSTTVFVTGATGTQGSATIRSLISKATPTKSINIHALVRDPSSSKASSLVSIASTGTSNGTVKLFKGTFDDIDSIKTAASGTTAAFINVSPSPDPSDPGAESRHASNILDALKATPSIERVVYTSVNGNADPTVPGNFKNLGPDDWMYFYFVSKWGIQESVRKTAEEKGWGYTVLQPSYFLTNLLPPYAAFVFPDMANKADRKIVTAFPRDYQLSYLDLDLVGMFAAAVFVANEKEMAERWNGVNVPLASGNATFEEIVAGINKVLDWSEGEGIKVVIMDLDEARKEANSNPVLGSQIMLIDNPKLVDLEKLKTYGFELGGVEEFFARNKKALEQAVGL